MINGASKNDAHIIYMCTVQQRLLNLRPGPYDIRNTCIYLCIFFLSDSGHKYTVRRQLISRNKHDL